MYAGMSEELADLGVLGQTGEQHRKITKILAQCRNSARACHQF